MPLSILPGTANHLAHGLQHWLDEIESGRIDLPKVLESYTGELLAQVDALFLATSMLNKKKQSRRIQKFYEVQL